MSDPFIGEVRIFAFGYVPYGWQLCDGSTLPIQQNQALYAVIGNTYGGTAGQNFKLPNLLGMAVSAPGVAPTGGTVSKQLGAAYGEAAVALAQGNLPAHSHIVQRQTNALGYAGKTAAPSATSNIAGLRNTTTTLDIFSSAAVPNTTLDISTIGLSGSPVAQAHDNLQPYQVFYWGIALQGIYPAWQ
jgi:microcystin-dependent protein